MTHRNARVLSFLGVFSLIAGACTEDTRGDKISLEVVEPDAECVNGGLRISINGNAELTCNGDAHSNIQSEHFGFGEGDNTCLSDAVRLTTRDAQGGTTTSWICEKGVDEDLARVDEDLLLYYRAEFSTAPDLLALDVSCAGTESIRTARGLYALGQKQHLRCAATLLAELPVTEATQDYVSCRAAAQRVEDACALVDQRQDGSPMDLCYEDNEYERNLCLTDNVVEPCGQDLNNDEWLEISGLDTVFWNIAEVCNPYFFSDEW